MYLHVFFVQLLLRVTSLVVSDHTLHPHVRVLATNFTTAEMRESCYACVEECSSLANFLIMLLTPVVRVLVPWADSSLKQTRKSATSLPIIFTKCILHANSQLVALPSHPILLQPFQDEKRTTLGNKMTAMQLQPSVLHFLTNEVQCQMAPHCYPRKPPSLGALTLTGWSSPPTSHVTKTSFHCSAMSSFHGGDLFDSLTFLTAIYCLFHRQDFLRQLRFWQPLLSQQTSVSLLPFWRASCPCTFFPDSASFPTIPFPLLEYFLQFRDLLEDLLLVFFPALSFDRFFFRFMISRSFAFFSLKSLTVWLSPVALSACMSILACSSQCHRGYQELTNKMEKPLLLLSSCIQRNVPDVDILLVWPEWRAFQLYKVCDSTNSQSESERTTSPNTLTFEGETGTTSTTVTRGHCKHTPNNPRNPPHSPTDPWDRNPRKTSLDTRFKHLLLISILSPSLSTSLPTFASFT